MGSSYSKTSNKGLGNTAKGKTMMVRNPGPEKTLKRGGVQHNTNSGLENHSYIAGKPQGQIESGAPKTWAARDRQSGFATFLPLRDQQRLRFTNIVRMHNFQTF
ncbi:hypothetical protein ACH5RR_041234 [Cinchona calisaya]|uniref:Uncharacterized protein n=1 Tax=Cinchona calisaya TaxID=153742 RepID=A0ABD2XW36_9GENT